MKHIWLIYLMGAAGIWKAIPVGFLMDTPPFYVGLMTALGAVSALLVIYFFGTRVKAFFSRKMVSGKRLRARGDRFNRIFEKRGAPGIGLIGALIFGPNMTLILGLVIHSDGRRILVWTMVGAVLWTIVLVIVASYSIELFKSLQLI